MSDAKPTRFFRLGKLMGLLLLGLVTYLVALVIWVPAGWLWQQASGHVRLPSQVSVRQVSGTLWEGAAGLEVLGYPVRVTWGLGAPSLTGLSLPLEVRLDSVRSHLEGHLTLTWPGAGSLDARGRVDVAEFEDLIRRSGGAMIEGAVDVERLGAHHRAQVGGLIGEGRLEVLRQHLVQVLAQRVAVGVDDDLLGLARLLDERRGARLGARKRLRLGTHVGAQRREALDEQTLRRPLRRRRRRAREGHRWQRRVREGSSEAFVETHRWLVITHLVITHRWLDAKLVRELPLGGLQYERGLERLSPQCELRVDQPDMLLGWMRMLREFARDRYWSQVLGAEGALVTQVRREASSCESASELLKTLTTHDAWEEIGAQIFEEMRAVCKGGVLMSRYYSPATGWLLEDMCSDLAVYRREAAAMCIQACWRGCYRTAGLSRMRNSSAAIPLVP